MTRKWQEIRVFISSTFRDMHAELDFGVPRKNFYLEYDFHDEVLVIVHQLARFDFLQKLQIIPYLSLTTALFDGRICQFIKHLNNYRKGTIL